MIGQLPTELEVNGNSYKIRADFRIALLIFQAINDPDLLEKEKGFIYLDAFYEDLDSMPIEDYQEAMEREAWFLDGGRVIEQNHHQKKLIDWEQDEQLLFPAVNKVAGTETRSLPFLHWWTFLGFFNEIGENSLFANVISIRSKKAKGKKLEKYEQEFYKENKDIIDIKTQYSEEEKAEIERLKKLLG